MTEAEQHEWESAQAKICEYCGINCSGEYHIDHIVPLSKGGPHQAHNLAIACKTCNTSKGDKDPDQFLDEITKGADDGK